MGDTDNMDLTLQGELLDSQTGEVFAAIVTRRSAAPKREGGKPKPLVFEELEALLRLGSDRLACRLNNARLPVEQRMDCAALAAPPAAPWNASCKWIGARWNGHSPSPSKSKPTIDRA